MSLCYPLFLFLTLKRSRSTLFREEGWKYIGWFEWLIRASCAALERGRRKTRKSSRGFLSDQLGVNIRKGNKKNCYALGHSDEKDKESNSKPGSKQYKREREGELLDMPNLVRSWILACTHTYIYNHNSHLDSKGNKKIETTIPIFKKRKKKPIVLFYHNLARWHLTSLIDCLGWKKNDGVVHNK